MIEVKDLTVGYGKKEILHGIYAASSVHETETGEC